MATSFTYNKAVNIKRLRLEITSNANITKAIDGFSGIPGTNVIVSFREDLPSEQVSILDGIVSDHINEPLPDEPDYLSTPDGKMVVKDESRPAGTSYFFTSRDDDLSQPTSVGLGSHQLKHVHLSTNETLSTTIEMLFNTENNRTWLYEPYLSFKGCLLDELDVIMKPKATPTTSSSGTNYLKYGGVILPVNGTGNVNLDINNLYCVYTVPKTDTGLCPAAYWNADYNSSTNTYGNLTPATNPNSTGQDGNGRYNLFTSEYGNFKKFASDFLMLGEATHFKLECKSPSEWASNVILQVNFRTHVDVNEEIPNHTWYACISFSTFRTISKL